MHRVVSLAAVLMLGSAAFAADPQLLNLVMPDAKVLAGMNVTTAKISPFGQYVLNQMMAHGDKDVNQFVAETGFDPRQDVSEILSATAGSQEQALILARGTFNVDKVVAAAAKDSHSKVQQYNGATLIAVGDGKLSHGVAFLGNSIAIAGDLASVKGAIDRHTSANSIDPALAARVQQLSTTEDAWSVTLSSLASLIPHLAGTEVKGPSAGMFNMVKDIQQSSGGVKFGTNVEVTAQAVTSDPKNASALGDVIRLVAGMATLAGGNDQHLADAAKLLQKLQVVTNGTSVNISLTVPEADLETLLQPVLKGQKI